MHGTNTELNSSAYFAPLLCDSIFDKKDKAIYFLTFIYTFVKGRT